MNSHLSQDTPSRWVSRFAPLIPSGLVLDLACGGGRHARLLAALGHTVLAVDRDAAALSAVQHAVDAAGLAITTRCVDLELQDASLQSGWPLSGPQFSGIVVTNYLHRPLLSMLLESLVDGGILIYETFAADNGRFGKPSNPAFLLAPGELLTVVGSDPTLRVLAYEDGYTDDPKPAMVQRICVRKFHETTLPESLRLHARMA